jgi:hypothetical protein
MTETEIALLARIVALERFVIGLMTGIVMESGSPDPLQYLEQLKRGFVASQQHASWDTAGSEADQIWREAVKSLEYLFAQIAHRVRAQPRG